jgi:hypothetical protein
LRLGCGAGDTGVGHPQGSPAPNERAASLVLQAADWIGRLDFSLARRAGRLKEADAKQSTVACEARKHTQKEERGRETDGTTQRTGEDGRERRKERRETERERMRAAKTAGQAMKLDKQETLVARWIENRWRRSTRTCRQGAVRRVEKPVANRAAEGRMMPA